MKKHIEESGKNMKAVIVIDLPCEISDVVDAEVQVVHGNWRFLVFPSCKLRPLPETKDVGYPNEDYDVGFGDGWNACLDAITGETE